MPSELVWRRSSRKSSKESRAKKRKLATDDSIIAEKLNKLEEKEGKNKEEDDEDKGEDDVNIKFLLKGINCYFSE